MATPGLIPWSAFSDVTERFPELTWPQSITTYSAMRTDTQIASLLLAFTLPIRRYGWYIDPNGARVEVVEDVASMGTFESTRAGGTLEPNNDARHRSYARHQLPRLL